MDFKPKNQTFEFLRQKNQTFELASKLAKSRQNFLAIFRFKTAFLTGKQQSVPLAGNFLFFILISFLFNG